MSTPGNLYANTLVYIDSNVKLLSGLTQYSFTVSGLSNRTYRIYLRAKNSLGFSPNSLPYSVTVYTTPIASITFDTANTRTVASGNLQVRITDLSNTSLNGVYYQYALNSFADASFANTFVRANVSPYTFFIPSITDISNTLYVRATNTVGNSSPAANLRVIVFQTPRNPSSVSFQLVNSGNVQVTIRETNPPDFYYLNNVSYYLYAYNTFGGNNLSGNTSLLVYNTPVGILSNTNSTYGNVVSYVNTGLNANTYTMYVIARNDFGNSIPVFANVSVFTTPVSPTIDVANTQSTSSGTLTVVINDTQNSAVNAVYYLYSMDGINYANSRVPTTAGITRYTFTINNTGNTQVPLTANTYTLYVAATNSVGNSVSSPSTALEIVYATPVSPTIDLANTQSTSSGTLTVVINDTVNSAVNGVYYLYSMDGINYANSRVPTTAGNTRYTFTINNTGNTQVPLIANTYTLYVAATNSVGNSISSPTTALEIVYTTPVSPIIDVANTQSTSSGTLTVVINDTVNTAVNGVYYLYSMDGVNYANSRVPTTAGNTRYTFTINNTGNAQVPLVANTYTLYVASTNPVGNSISSPSTALEIVYTTPVSPIIDVANTQSTSSGTLTVVINDTVNRSVNGVYYLYSMDGINYANSRVPTTAGNTRYTFTINNTGNTQVPLIANTYTLYVAATNSVGNSISSSATALEIVYTTPVSPTIDLANTQSTSSGTLTVVINDTVNSATNGVYYLYSMDGINYANSRVPTTAGNTRYTFTINNTGNTQVPLIANTYTLYVASTNSVGNSISTPATALEIVYTTPVSPTIDVANTQSTSSGTLTVVINDTQNRAVNGVYYLYSMDGINYANSRVSTTAGITRYTFTINNTGNTQVPLTANTYTLYVAATNSVGNSISSPATALEIVYTTPTNISFDTGNTNVVAHGNLKVTINDTSNNSMNGVYYFYSVDSGQTYANSNVPNNGPTNTVYTIYVPYNSTAIQPIYIRAQNPGGNSTPIGLSIQSPFNPTSYTTSNQFFIDNSTNYSFLVTGFTNKTYNVYLRSENSVGISANSVPYSVTVYTTPIASITFDTANTRTVASGNLQVRITDLSNTSLNGVYYQYALNSFADASFANTFVRANVSPYTFFIPSITDISNTLYVRASNPVGNSSPAANLQVIVFQTPRNPSSVSFQLVNSGNVQVTIRETNPPDFYYLNNVSYYLYAYNTFGGNNLSGNTSLLVYNTPVGILSNTNSTYGNVVSYINTGLNANTYTMYVIARNDFGNSNPVFANVSVFTTPVSPTIDVANTQSTSSGTLTVVINDTVNRAVNGVYYLYSMDGINYANSRVPTTAGNTRYTFTINNTGNTQVPLTANTYTLYVAATNPIGNSISSPATALEIVYTTPVSPTIDLANTQSTSSGTLTVVINDTQNSATNGVYYLYSMDGVNYANSRVPTTAGNTRYTFTINNTGNTQVPLTAGTYTLYVAATNPIGNSISSPSTALETVFTTPFAPTIDQGNTKSITSGNLKVAFTDTLNVGNNQVEYIHLIYDPTIANSIFFG